jgi:hypothetical protein
MTGPRNMPLWQRNLVGTLVTVAALAIFGSAIAWPLWTKYRSTVQPAHVVAAHQSFTLDGQTWSVSDLTTSRRARGSGAPLPEGTVLTTVTVHRMGSIQAGFRCNGILTDGERRWRAVGPPCSEPGSMEWTFLIPDDAQPTAVDVMMLDGSILLRLRL